MCFRVSPRDSCHWCCRGHLMVLLFSFFHCYGLWYCSLSWPGPSVLSQLFFCRLLGLTWGTFSDNRVSAGEIPCSGLNLSMHLTGTLSATTLPHVWTLLFHLFPWYYVVTSMLFLKKPKIVGALILLSPSVRALSHWSYFSRSFVFWMFGTISIPIFALTLGWNPMVPCPPASTLLAFRLSAFILCLPALLFHVLSLITMPFFSASLFLNCFLVALANGNWMFGSSGILWLFFQFFSDFWPRWRSRKPSFSTLQHWWDRCKEHLKRLAVRHCSGAHDERSLSRSVLSALACHLKDRIEYSGPSPYYNLTFFRPQFYQFLTLQ